MKNNHLESQFTEFAELIEQLEEEDVEKWVKQQKIDYIKRQQRYLKAILLTINLMNKTIHQKQTFLECLIIYHNYSKKKVEEFILIIFYYKRKDYEAQFIYNILLQQPYPRKSVAIYLKTRNVIMNTYKAKNNKDFLMSISYDIDGWFNVINSIFSVQPRKLVSKFTQGVKDVYKKQVKSQQSDLNGADILYLNHFYLADLFQDQTGKRATQRSTTDRTPSKLKKSLTPTHRKQLTVPDKNLTPTSNLRPVNEVISSRQSQLINKITTQVDDLRNALGRQKNKIQELSQRQKYFMFFISKIKGQFCSLINKLHSRPSVFDEYQVLDPLIDKFKQYELNIFRKQSNELKQIQSKQQEFKLIKQIQRQQNNMVNYAQNKFK